MQCRSSDWIETAPYATEHTYAAGSLYSVSYRAGSRPLASEMEAALA
jgi:hypothetical protein